MLFLQKFQKIMQRPETTIIKELSLPQVEKGQLDNGIKTYFIKSSNEQLSQIKFVFGSGVWEQDQLLVANTTANMLLKGTESHTAEEIADFFDFYGIKFNPSVGMHSTTFTLYTLNKHAEKALNFAKEILSMPIFPEKELKLITQEKKQQLTIMLEQVDYVAHYELGKQIFGENYPYGWQAMPDDYDRLSIELLQRYFDVNFYRDNLQIIIVSNEKEKTLRLLNKIFNDYKDKSSKTKRLDYQLISKDRYRYIEKEESLQSAVNAGWKAVRKNHPDYYDIYITNTLFGGYFGSRLMQNIRQKLGLTYGIYSQLSFEKYSGWIEIASEVKKEAKERVVEEIKKEIMDLQKNLVSEQELDKVRRYLSGSLLRSIDGEFNYSNAVVSFIVYDRDFDTYNKIFEHLHNITSKRIKEIANKYYNLDEMFLTIVG